MNLFIVYGVLLLPVYIAVAGAIYFTVAMVRDKRKISRITQNKNDVDEKVILPSMAGVDCRPEGFLFVPDLSLDKLNIADGSKEHKEFEDGYNLV